MCAKCLQSLGVEGQEAAGGFAAITFTDDAELSHDASYRLEICDKKEPAGQHCLFQQSC
jgi:hypothetical protein